MSAGRNADKALDALTGPATDLKGGPPKPPKPRLSAAALADRSKARTRMQETGLIVSLILSAVAFGYFLRDASEIVFATSANAVQEERQRGW